MEKVVVTTNRIANGLFDVLFNGEKTHFRIYNGCVGYSGKTNLYGINNTSLDTWKIVGSLAQCKKRVALSLKKRAEILQ